MLVDSGGLTWERSAPRGCIEFKLLELHTIDREENMKREPRKYFNFSNAKSKFLLQIRENFAANSKVVLNKYSKCWNQKYFMRFSGAAMNFSEIARI